MHTLVAYTPPLDPIELRFPVVMTNAEMAAWCQVGKNTVPHIVRYFGLNELSGAAKNHRFGLHEVMGKIINVTPPDDAEIKVLLYPLQKVTWVSERTGLSVSSINAAVCENRLLLPAPIEVTPTQPGRTAARGRRWVPAQIEAYIRNDPIPFQVAPEPRPVPKSRSKPTFRNAFEAICSDNAEVSS
ncbi:hypothetical protein J3456_19080 [Sulfitobacter sp. NFXS29]|uniref:hypothetical protein n=1 Tax=Sulfitobacter sp. NFXS29 TaxID=2818438 RepID=UPI0032E0145F